MTLANNRIKEIFSGQERLCFGRFLVDIPSDSIVAYGPAQLDGEITVYPNSATNISELVNSQLIKINNRRSDFPEYSLEELPLIGKVFDGALPGQKILFGIENSVSYDIHSYIPIKKNLFIYNTSSLPGIDEIPIINKIASALRYRGKQEIPSEPGICIEGAFLQFDPKYESIAIGLRLKEFPDVRISIEARKNQNHLLEAHTLRDLREKAKGHAASTGFENFFSRIKILRDEKRTLGIWEGEEILTRRPAFKKETDAHEFRFFSLGLPNAALHPMLDIRLDSGVEGNVKSSVRPSITDDEALALWDRIISTVRVRLPSDATPPKVIEPKIPLGTISKSGETCSETGFWECTDKRRVDGDRRRLFKSGEKIPPVIVTGYKSFLRTLIGDVYRVASVEWTLMAYETLSSVPGDVDIVQGQVNSTKDPHA